MHDSKLFLMADDDPEDQELFLKAFTTAAIPHRLSFVADGEELLDYLLCRNEYANGSAPDRPDLILLDLNMPRLDGHGALREIKKVPEIADIPVIVLTTSTSEHDVEETYRLGAQSYIEKPASFKELVARLREIETYWTMTSRSPERHP
jgi:CheY-like chemotaxis protein